MSTRNPMNERYNTPEEGGATGHTRKSAASAKPKAKAAASVTIQSTTKSPQQKKAEQKAARKRERAEQRELDRKYYTPDTQTYKTLRRIWWACLIGAIIATAGSWFTREMEPLGLSMVCMVVAYALIIAAFYLDFSKIRKERIKYQTEMIAKEEREKKAAKAAARAEKQKAGKNSKKK